MLHQSTMHLDGRHGMQVSGQREHALRVIVELRDVQPTFRLARDRVARRVARVPQERVGGRESIALVPRAAQYPFDQARRDRGIAELNRCFPGERGVQPLHEPIGCEDGDAIRGGGRGGGFHVATVWTGQPSTDTAVSKLRRSRYEP
ncbi:MAG: hypothetical protein IPJ56_15225 [Gemmatimonadetes bacterium]|nr:hypothetical protein [Gemmatimonadota bacterium]